MGLESSPSFDRLPEYLLIFDMMFRSSADLKVVKKTEDFIWLFIRNDVVMVVNETAENCWSWAFMVKLRCRVVGERDLHLLCLKEISVRERFARNMPFYKCDVFSIHPRRCRVRKGQEFLDIVIHFLGDSFHFNNRITLNSRLDSVKMPAGT